MKLRSKVAALLGAGALVMAVGGTALAQTGNQTNVAWNASASDCTGGPNGDFTVDEGQVAWIFVHANPDSQSGTLSAHFTTAGDQQASSYIQGGVKYMIVTDAPDTLESFSDDIDGGQLTLSHTCYNSESSSSSSSDSSESSSSSSESSSTSFTGSESGESSVNNPSEPNTATIGTTGTSGSSDGWLLVAAIGALVGSLLVLTPARAKNKR